MTSSPFKVLTFSRRVSTPQALRYRTATRPATLRPFSISTIRSKSPNVVSDKGTQHDTGAGQDVGASREHALDKGGDADHNVQSSASGAGRSEKAQDAGGSATRGKDERNSTAQAKKEHPEAPDVVIGMQDERGGKGA